MTDLQASVEALAEKAFARVRAAEEKGERGKVVCRECGGGGWVEVSPTGQGTVRPCSRCATAGWLRWKEGHQMPGHWCEECEDLRRHAAMTPKGRQG